MSFTKRGKCCWEQQVQHRGELRVKLVAQFFTAIRSSIITLMASRGFSRLLFYEVIKCVSRTINVGSDVQNDHCIAVTSASTIAIYKRVFASEWWAPRKCDRRWERRRFREASGIGEATMRWEICKLFNFLFVTVCVNLVSYLKKIIIPPNFLFIFLQ